MLKNVAKKPKLLVLAAGTGGHVYPALSVADHLAKEGWHVDWLGTSTGVESRLVPQAGYQLHTLEIAGIRGKGLLTVLPNVWRAIKSVVKAWALIGNIAPDVVLGMGGYVAGPAGMAAFLRRKPLLIHEQNAVAGLTNRLLKPFASLVMQAFPNSFNDSKVMTVGNPIRQAFVSAIDMPLSIDRNDTSSLNATSLERGDTNVNSPFNLLVVGGSLGAQAINRVMPDCIQQLSVQTGMQIHLWHQCGTNHLQETRASYGNNVNNITIDAFIDNMPNAFAWADLIICRAGALTVSEVAATGKPAVFIPFPYAVDDHQTANASILAAAGAGILIPAQMLDVSYLTATLLPLLTDNNRREEMSLAAKKLARPHATFTVANQCIEALNGTNH